MKEFDLLVSKLKEADATVICGLGGISMEEQRLAVSLAKKLGAVVSVERPLLPTVTQSSLNGCDLVLYAGGQLPFALAEGVKTLQDDRLLCVDAWRCVASLFRGNKLMGAEEYLPLYEDIKNADSAAVVLIADDISEELRRTVVRFVGEAHRVGIMQIPSCANIIGAYEVMLEEAGGTAAWFGDEVLKGCEFAVENIPAKGCDLLLRIGCGKDAAVGDAARFAVAAKGYEGECLVKAVSGGGTALRYDGVPCDMAAEDGENSVFALLTRLMEEVEA